MATLSANAGKPQPIIDCHCHAGKGDGFTGPWDTDAPLHAYLRRAAASGIERTILLPAFSSDYGEANRDLAKIVARAPHRLQAFAMVHAARDRGRIHELVATAVQRHGSRWSPRSAARRTDLDPGPAAADDRGIPG